MPRAAANDVRLSSNSKATVVDMCNRVRRFASIVLTALVLALLPAPLIAADPPTQNAPQNKRPAISIHPQNPKYFLFRGKPTFLLTATEHYGSVLNRPFDFRKYLDDLVDKRMTATRTFLLYREIATEKNPASTCKPRPEDYIAPWPRKGPDLALDGQPKFDLDAWNPEFFERLHKFLDAASERGIIVELTFLSNTYMPEIWALNPLRAENNLQGVGKIEWPEYISLKDPKVVERQLAYVQKIVQETARYDNVYYEICNEPGGDFPGHVTSADVDSWQLAIVGTAGSELARLGRKHLIFGSKAFTFKPKVTQVLDDSFTGRMFDVVNVHPHANVVLNEKHYQLGNFMSKELQLAPLIDFCRAARSQRKAFVLDEDNAASKFQDEAGWTIHRKRAWVALLSGSHYDVIDFSIQNGRETGTPESSSHIRKWFKILSEFFASIDYIHAAPAPDFVDHLPDHVLATTLAVKDQDFVACIADAREVTDKTAGEPISGKVQLNLPPGQFRLRFFSPVEGTYSGDLQITGGKNVSLDLPPFRNDIVIRAQRRQ